MQEVGVNETEVTEFIIIGWSGRPKSRMALMTYLLVSYTAIVVGNGLIVFVVIYDPRLHNPMYLFLCNLSILDLCITTAAIPKSIANCLEDKPVVPVAMCYTQLYAILYFGTVECFLLAVMAYDRYVAISNPLRYSLIMNRTLCIILATATWISAFLISIAPCLAKPARFCGNNEIDHIGCEFKSVFKLICTDTSLSQISIYFTSTLTLVFPLSFILFSYMRILVIVLRMNSEGSRMKAFSTCGSHLAVVSMYYGTSMFIYLLPENEKSREVEKILGEFNTAVPPMFNPLIYALKNKEVLGAFQKLIGRKM